MDRAEAQQNEKNSVLVDEEEPGDVIEKPRKIIFDRHCTEYFELKKMISKNMRNKFADSKSFIPKPKMPYKPNIWLKLNLDRKKTNASREEGLAATENMLKILYFRLFLVLTLL